MGAEYEALHMKLSRETIVVAAKGQVSCALNGEAAILNIGNGTYYGLDPVGAEIWRLVQNPQRVSEISEAVVALYDVQPERCENDIIDLLEMLLAEGLIETREDPTP